MSRYREVERNLGLDEVGTISAEGKSSGRVPGALRTHVVALASHLFLSIFFTWPLALNLLPGAPSRTPGIIVVDRDQNLWNLWWVRHALFNGQNPFVTDVIWYPTPVSLYYHTLNVFNGLLAIPLLSVFSLVTTYNLIVLFSFVMSGYGAFLLVQYISGNAWAGMIGSVVFAYSAFHIATMRGLLQLISVEWVPFYVLFLLKALQSAKWENRSDFGRWFLRAGLPAGFFLFLIALVDWYYTMYMLILTALLVLRALFFAVRGRDGRGLDVIRDVIIRAALPLIVVLMLIAPIFVPTIAELRTNTYMRPASDETLRYSADLLAFFQPPQDQRLWGQLFQNRGEWPFGTNRYEVYFTYTALFFMGVCLFATRNLRPGARSLQNMSSDAMPTKWFWAVCALLFFLLALGPVLQVNGQQVRGFFDTAVNIPMPYQLIEIIPVLNISRSPDRFDMPLTLCMAILAGYGANVLLQTWGRRIPIGRRGTLLVLVATILIAIELFPAPYPQRPAVIPAWYAEVAKQEGDFSILELPPQDDYWHGAYRMYFQTAHEKPIFGGYISREYPHPFLERTPGFQELTYADEEGDMFESGPETWNSALAFYKVGYIVLQKTRLPDRADPPPDISAWRQAIRRIGGERFQLKYSDEFMDVFSVPRPKQLEPFMTVGDGWGEREVGPNGSFRWMGDRAFINVQSPEAKTASLSFRVAGLGPERTMRIYHRNIQVFEGKVGALQELTISPLSLPSGQSTLEFRSPDGTVSPADLGNIGDERQLSFAVLDAKLNLLGASNNPYQSSEHPVYQRGR